MKMKKYTIPVLTGVIVILVLALAFLGYRMFIEPRIGGETYTAEEGESEQLTDAEVERIVRRVGRLIMLPQDEEPLVAKVVDVDALVETQPFYIGAQNDDILLIYPATAKAILYNPSDNILVNVGPIILDEEQIAAQAELEAAGDFSSEDAVEE